MAEHLFDNSDWCERCKCHRKDASQVDCEPTPEELQTELDRAHETIARLNRRCQSAERGLAAKLNPGPRNFGRILANSAATMWHAWALEMAQGILANVITQDVLDNARQIVNETAGQTYADLTRDLHDAQAALLWLYMGDGQNAALFERHMAAVMAARKNPAACYAAGVKQ